MQSRYYDATVGRFINADDTTGFDDTEGSLIRYNLFAYCLNNPVNMADETGYCAANIIGGIIGGVSGAVLGVLLADALGLKGWKKAALVAGCTVAGAALGAFIGPYVAKLSTAVATKIATAVGTAGTAANKLKSTVNYLINNASKLRRTATVMKNIASRPYINSTLTIQNIMRSGTPVKDPSLVNGLKWVVSGSYNGTKGTFELVVDVTTNTIVHFLFRK